MSPTLTFTYTLYHVFLLKLLISFPFEDKRTLHNFLFLAKVNANPPGPRFIYEFYKSRQGAYSFEVEGHMRDLANSRLLGKEALSPSREGREFYYRVASLLRYELFPEHCTRIASRYQEQLWRVNHEIHFHPLYRKARLGRKINI